MLHLYKCNYDDLRNTPKVVVVVADIAHTGLPDTMPLSIAGKDRGCSIPE